METDMKLRTIGVSIAAALGIALISTPGFAQGTIQIGMTSALTGPYNEYGEGGKRGVDIALERSNERGGINGKKIELAMALEIGRAHV